RLMAAFDVDLFVIGGGSGGVRAARIAAGHGARVAIAEEYRFGGTCVIRGCVPKKLLVYASRFADEFVDARGFGWTVGTPTFDWASLIAAKDIEIARLEAIYRSGQVRAGVAVHDERAEVAGPNAVRLVKSDRIVTAAKILIATGGRPYVDPDMAGREHAVTSDEAFHLPVLPRRVVVEGGGYIAVEFAGIFHGLGSETTIVYRGDKILRGFDEDMRDALTEELSARGVRIVTRCVIERVENTAAGHVAHLSGGDRIEADQVMLAIGRRPNTAALGLEAAGVALGPQGEIIVDARSQTSVPSIFAVGDVTNRVNLTPVAIREGHAFADSAFGGKPWTSDHAMIPTAVFSTPEIGTVGLSEADAQLHYGALDIYKARFRPMKGILAGRAERMVMNLVVDRASQKVVGCH
ncbi:MAG: glutathione-disulfide reductase, partial [Hyphomicrobium sp.]